MSYEIVRGIKIRANKVFIKASSNNVYPKDWSEEECISLSKILQEQGKEKLDIEILKEFENGNFYSCLNNKYTRALKILKFVFGEEYKKFDWKTPSITDDKAFKDNREMRESQAFKDLLLKALNTKLPKQKFILAKRNYDKMIFAKKETSRHLFYTDDISQAKKYDFKEQATRTAQIFGLSNFEILESQEEQKKAIGNDTARDNQASGVNLTPQNQTIGEPTK